MSTALFDTMIAANQAHILARRRLQQIHTLLTDAQALLEKGDDLYVPDLLNEALAYCEQEDQP